MRFGYSETCLEHDTGPRHPESSDRLRAIRQRIEDAPGGRFVDPEPADRETVMAVHDAEYVAELESFCAAGGGSWDSDTVLSTESWTAALASAGLAIWASLDARPADEASAIPFALGRPPGHHALADDAMGFCLFNNAAVGAQAALDAGEAETVAIVDLDVHHGNGTQDIFFDRGDVGYASIHEAGLYPGTGAIDEVGRDEGEGRTVNVPLVAGAETVAYLVAIDELIRPWLDAFDPDVLLVSAGFDAHRHDPISRMAVTTEGFGALTERLLAWSRDTGTAVGFVLEGGYGLDTLADGVAMVEEVCGGYEPIEPDGTLREDDRDRIDEARARHGLGS